MQSRSALVAAIALVLIGSLYWTRTAASDGTTADAPSSTVALPTAPAPPASPAGPAPSGLDPGLVAALDRAVVAARAAGHHLSVTSGYRTVAQQEALLADAVAEHGAAEAVRWVFPPDRSMHVRGLAVDVGDGDAARWLDRHGARFGLCRTLAWEWWHFEWRRAWETASSCPRPVDDPADAPT